MSPLADLGRLPPRSALIPGGIGLLLSAVAHAALLPLVGWAWLGTPREERQEVVEVSIELVSVPRAVTATTTPPPTPMPPPTPPRPVAAKPRLVPQPAPVQAPAPAVQPVTTEPSVTAKIDGPESNVAALPPEHAPALAAGPAAQPDFSAYARLLLEQLERHKIYPPLSARRGEEGTVTLRLALARDGTVLAVEPTGEAPRRLVEASLAAVQAASPFPPVPADFTGATAAFTLPVAYRLR